MELKTFAGDNKGTSYVARGGNVSTGLYKNNCSGPNCLIGGNPFNHQVDTLCFYYKYTPSGNDTAQISLNFKKNGNAVNGTGLSILASAFYQYVEFPFNAGAPIDTVIVSIQSSSWRDTALTYIGSDLKIDEIHFKSQPLNTGIESYNASQGVQIFPNPSTGSFIVRNIDRFDLIRVISVYGQEINAVIKTDNGMANVTIDSPGIYFVYVNSRGKAAMQKVIVGKE